MGGHDRCTIGVCINDKRYPERYETHSNVKGTIKMHKLPIEENRRRIWIQSILKSKVKPNTVLPKNCFVCSIHFFDGEPTKENPNPTLFLTPEMNCQKTPEERPTTPRIDFSDSNIEMQNLGEMVHNFQDLPTEKLLLSAPVNLIRDNNQIKIEEEEKPAEEESSDYEYSLRIENIRLKSRLEQFKEKSSSLEREKQKLYQEIKNEQNFTKKANNKVFILMQEKQNLEDQLKRNKSLIDNKGVEEVVRKMEHDMYMLEERLDKQRKRYQREQIILYEDLKDERRKREQWKQTYFKSQVAVMSFRRKIEKLKPHINVNEYKKLTQCLEVVDDAYISKTDLADSLTHRKFSNFNNNRDTRKFNGSHPSPSYETSHLSPPPIVDYFGNDIESAKGYLTQPHQHENNHKDMYGISTQPEIPTEPHPKVFIMDDENSIVRNEPSPSNHLKETNKYHQSYANNVQRQSDAMLGTNRADPKYPIEKPTKNQPSNSTFRYKPSSKVSSQHKSYRPYSSTEPYNIENKNFKSYKFKTYDPFTKQDYKHSGFTSKTYSAKDPFNDQVSLDANAKFLELKFDNSFLSKEISSPMRSDKTYNFARTSMVDQDFNKSPQVKAGTPLSHKKIWCLRCDADVTNNSCDHATELVIQEREKEFPCPSCGRLFNNRSHLKRHHMIHSGEKPWPCTYCDKRFNRKSHLNRHLLTHTGEKPFKCPTCGKGFADNSDLKRHRQIHEISPHLTPRNNNISSLTSISPLIQTSVSDVSMTSSSTSSFTTSVIRKQEAKFPCNVCGKYFTRKSHLTRHKLTHDQHKIYCDCGRMFRQRAHLNAHLPSCKRKRDAIEAKYKAQVVRKSNPSDNNETPINENNADNKSFIYNYHDEKINENSLSQRPASVGIGNNSAPEFGIENCSDFTSGGQVEHDQLAPISVEQMSVTSNTYPVHVKHEDNDIPIESNHDLNFNISATIPNLPPLIKDPML